MIAPLNDELPGPGIYEDVPFEAYLSWPYISNSRLHLAAKSMAHFNAGVTIEETEAMRLGSLVHCGRLEPLELAQRYVIMPPFEEQVRKPDGSRYEKPKASAAYKQAVDDFEAANKGKSIVTQSQYDAMRSLVAALVAHERANAWLNASGPVEVSIVWDDPETGIRCKGRIDKWLPQHNLVIDLKASYDPLSFEQHIAKRAYHRQGAMYCEGIGRLTGKPHRFGLVAAETASPWTVRAALLSQESQQVGFDQFHDLLGQLMKAKRTNIWPGAPDPDEWELPRWATPAEEPLSLRIDGQSVSL